MISKNNFRQKIENPWSLVLIELTSFCNFNCSFCPSGSMNRKKSVMKRELWEKIICEISKKKMAPKVQFHLLGEPLLNKNVFDAIKLANNLGLFVSLYTNGLLLKKDIAIKLLNSLKKGRIVISLQNISEESFAERCRGAISWQNYIKRLKDFIQIVETRKYSPYVQIHCMADLRGMGWNKLKILSTQKRIQDVYDEWRKVMRIKEKIKINIGMNP